MERTRKSSALFGKGRKAIGWALLVPLVAVFAALSGAAAEEPTNHTIKVVTYNVGPAGSDLKADIVRLVDTERPAVIGLQEVADSGDEARVRAAAAATDYQLIYEHDRQAVEHNAILVRPNVTVLAHGAYEISPESRVNPSTPGTGSEGCGCLVPPKYVNWVRVRAAGFEWVVGVVHLTPSAQHYDLNRQLHDKQVNNSAEWFDARTAEPILMGDFNAASDAALMDGMRDVGAKPFSDESFGTHRIDHVWTKRSATGSDVDALRGYHSDHRPVRVQVTVTR